MSSLTVEEEQKWVPTHVQVTVLRGRGLRGKGKHGTSDVYTIIQLGKEKYSTCVAEKTTEPEWREECTFELQPGVLESCGRSGSSAGSSELVLTVMHRALIGLDVFLGQAVVQLEKVFHESRCLRNEWYRLNSKTGKKEKERGDIQVTVQFTRNNLTASMYDLVMKDKSASTFGKLKERMRGKRRSSEEDSSSAVLPGGYGSLCRMRQRLPSDGGGEEDYEDDEGGEVRRSKMRTFFLRGKLRKSSDTRSSTSLGSESSESSSRGGSLSPTAGISVVVSDLSNSPSNSSNLTADNSPEHTENTSPKSSSSLQCEFGDEASEISIAVPQPTVCVNGSHAYSLQPPDPGSGKPSNSLGLGLLQKPLPLSVSLQNLSPRAPADPKGPVGDGRRWSFDKPGEEEKAAIAAALEQSGPMVADEEEEEEWLGKAAPPRAVESESQGKKQRRNFLNQGRSESAGRGPSQGKDESEHAAAAAEERHKGWFGSKDSHSKPSLVVSPKLEPSPHLPPLPPSHHPAGPPVHSASLISPLHHTNPFCHSQSTTPPPISPDNPFFSLLQCNPFYEDMLAAEPLKPPLPPLPFLSSSRPPIAQLFPQVRTPNPALTRDNPAEDAITGTNESQVVLAKAGKRPLPPTPSERETPFSRGPSSPFASSGELEADSEWDEGFEAFAAGRLQSPEDLTTDCKTQQNPTGDFTPGHCSNTGAVLPTTAENTSVNAQSSLNHFDTFAFLETIPEHTSFEAETLNTPTNPPGVGAPRVETNQANLTTNAVDLTDTTLHQAPLHSSSMKPGSSSPDPGSSGLGSSAEDDFLSCLSSYSDKFSASSSSEEAETQNCDSNVLNFESALVKNFRPSESEDDITDKSNDLSLVDKDETVIQHADGDEKVDVSEGCPHQQPEVAARETPDLQPNSCEEKETGESLEDLSEAMTTPTPDDELFTKSPLVHIITSSPNERHSSPIESTALEEQDASRLSATPLQLFGHFSGPSQGLDDTLFHSRLSDQSSFLQSFISTDSQDYQTCTSHQTSKCSSNSEPNETLHSANSTLCGEIQMTAGAVSGQDDSAIACKTPYEEPKAEGISSTPEPHFLTGEDLGLEVVPAESESVVLVDLFPECPQAQTLPRSEDTLVPAFAELPLPSSATLDPRFLVGEDLGLEVVPAESENVVLVDLFPECPQAQTLPRSEDTLVPAFAELPLPSSATLDPRFLVGEDLGLEVVPAESENVVLVDLFPECPQAQTLPRSRSEDTLVPFDTPPLPSSATLDPCVLVGEDLGLEVVPAKGDAESENVVLVDLFPECPQAQTLPRSRSEDTLVPAFDELPLPSSATLDPRVLVGEDFGLEVVPADSHMSPRRLTEEGESQNITLDAVFPRCPQAQPLHRSQSEGTLIPAFDELLLPSFGSDPGAVQEESSSALPGPALPSLASFAPSLTPDCSGSPVLLCSLPLLLANASARSPPSTTRAAAPKPLPQESGQQQAANQQTSPHPVKPLTTAMLAEEKRTEGRSVLATGLEKLKSTIHPGRSSQLSEQETDKRKSLTEGAGSYYHLNHNELVALLVQREAELARQKVEFERQRCLLAKREVELRRLKPQVRDLEDYIDTLLVRIMEQKPTLLQVRTKLK